MAIIPLPPAARIKRVDWAYDRPSQVNRSDWTKRRQVVRQPGPSLWSASFDLVVTLGEANFLAIEAWLIDLDGPVNSFRLVATESPQNEVGLPLLVDGAGQAGQTLALKGGVPGAFLRRGHKLTINDQMVMLMAPLMFDANGKASASFKPSLRTSPANNAMVEAIHPSVLVSLVGSQVGWSVDPGQQYAVKTLQVEEAL